MSARSETGTLGGERVERGERGSAARAGGASSARGAARWPARALGARRLSVLSLLLAALGCASERVEEPAAPEPTPPETCERTVGHESNSLLACDARCPGGAGCAASTDTTLYAAAAVTDITPVIDHIVVNENGEDQSPEDYEPSKGDRCVEKASCDLAAPASCPKVDAMKCTWIAGFGNGRAAAGVADPTSARCGVFRQGETTIALCALDVVGWFYNEIQATRELLRTEYPDVDIDLLVVGSTHVHQTQDTMGIWGPSEAQSGVKASYNERVRRQTAAAVAEAARSLRPVRLELGASRVDGHIAGTDPRGRGAAAFVSDTRDPVVLDNELRTLRALDLETGETLFTLLNFASHPEFAGSENVLITSDYVGALRTAVESGLEVKSAAGAPLLSRPGVGGVAIFFNGALGGQVGPGEVQHTDFEGQDIDGGLGRAYNNGRLLSVYAHEALTVGVTRADAPQLGFRAREVYGRVSNALYLLGIQLKIFQRDGELYDKTRFVSGANAPSLRTQLAVLDLGPAELVTVPGEVFPELALATADGKTSLDAPYPFTPAPYFVNNDPATNPDCGKDGHSRCDDGPPDLKAFDRTKVLDLARAPTAKYKWLLGLTQDELGYILPEYDFKLDPKRPYTEEASPGNHYEETNSVGPSAQQHFIEPLLDLMRSTPVVPRD